MKHFVSADSLRTDSYQLAAKVVKSGFKPDYLVAIWRGGAPIGCYVHELLKYVGMKTDHIAIRTSRYSGIDQAHESVQVYNLGYLSERVNKSSKILLVDDVYDTGLSIKAVYDAFKERFGDNCPEDIRTATVYFKPSRNKTDRVPEYYVHESDKWLVFPHEIEGLTLDEISHHINPETASLVAECVALTH
ncbi:hypoxanthine phosphoribosyltransferase [Fadolivirus algeromassiliense]|jgi:hypothetical protein|uniref:Hypoxanthine phosphoribosyltransferase n=1 Tax=Fadolivirus FV1/VV64 TaxID=3070911 RepID=A0A7D3R1V7_9VIRU|nr:hypoxanthine phosphoribosyltransferase [Fadolivirus algeromassiliense]QKF94822.1 hypoxanthine phosphoribosyltransferase [Fadolivirus FV1/VV64]